MKVLIAGKVNAENKQRVEEMAADTDRTVSYTLDKILSDYFREQNKERIA